MQIEELEILLNNTILEAFTEGMSIVEIARALREDHIEQVHSLIRYAKLIPAMEPRDRRTNGVDCRLVVAMQKVGYSFGRWCMGWHFDPDNAKAVIKDMPCEENPSAVHQALKRDFPATYYRIYDGIEQNTAEEPPAAHHSITINWDPECEQYVAKIIEMPEIVATGNKWDTVFSNIKRKYYLHIAIDGLIDALNKRVEGSKNPAIEIIGIPES